MANLRFERLTVVVALAVTPALTSSLLASPAHADEKKDPAAHLKAGKKLLEKKEYLKAKVELLAAQEQLGDPESAYYLGRAYEGLGEDANAAAAYDKATATAGKIPADLAKDAATRAAALRKKPVKVTLDSAPESASVRIDGTEIAQKTPFFMHLAPGSHKFVFALPGKPEIVRDELIAPLVPAVIRVEFDPKPVVPTKPTAPVEPTPKVTPTPTPTPTPEPMPPAEAPLRHVVSHRWICITGTAALGFLAFGGIYGVKTLIDKSKYDAQQTPERRDLGQRDALIADVALGIGLGLAVTTVVLWVKTPSSSNVALVPWVSPALVGAGATFRF
ncbi:MAG: hypothetical protein IPJ34_28650 [Myxococcales bacterium]|nr:hypothetical protein [Myxococcales bacterium]